MKREVNLIGGFYKDNSLTFSAQDTVNWLPVPDESSGARSPIKLRGLPGLKSLNEDVRITLRILGDSPSGVVGTPYSFTYTAEGGTPPYTFSFVSGTLPAGLSFSAGTISGTPTTQETDSYRVRVTDSLLATDEKDDQIQIVPVPAREIVVVPVVANSPAGGVVTVPLPSGYGAGDLLVVARVQGNNPGAAGTLVDFPTIGNDFVQGSNASAGGVFSVYAGYRITTTMAASDLTWTLSAATPQNAAAIFVFIPGEFWTGALVGVPNLITPFTTTTPAASFSSWTGDKAILFRFVFGGAAANIGITSFPDPKDFSGTVTSGTGANQASVSYTIAIMDAQNVTDLTFPASNPINGVSATFPMRLNTLAAP